MTNKLGIILRTLRALRFSDQARKRFKRFRSIKRGWYSLLALVLLTVLAQFAEIFISNRALFVAYEGKYYLPTYGNVHLGTEFGYQYSSEVNYRQLKIDLAANKKGFVLLPLIPWGPLEQDTQDARPPQPPNFSKLHILGTDIVGRDVFARLIYGYRSAINFAIIVVFSTMFIGTVVGCLMGYIGGKFDILFQRLLEILGNLPVLYVIMILVSIFKPSIAMFLFIFISISWIGYTGIARIMTYKEKEQDYVRAAKTMRASTLRIILVHIIPNIVVVLVTSLPFAVIGGMSTLVGLDYLGFGMPPPTPSWGELLSQGRTHLEAYWILGSAVGATILILVLVTFVGESLREAFDPKRHTYFE